MSAYRIIRKSDGTRALKLVSGIDTRTIVPIISQMDLDKVRRIAEEVDVAVVSSTGSIPANLRNGGLLLIKT